MSRLLNNSGHWHLRAQEAQMLALQLNDAEAIAATLRIADEYERLAARAARREQDYLAGENDNKAARTGLACPINPVDRSAGGEGDGVDQLGGEGIVRTAFDADGRPYLRNLRGSAIRLSADN